jgi:oligoribonuclease NrnB/cAMP/cGMP phosphodiesterase (DHH superfamily)
MDEALFADDRPLERLSLVPGKGFFVPEDLREDRDDAEVEAAVADADVVVVTDSDADGLAAAAMIREAHDGAGVVPSGPGDVAGDLERVVEYADASHVYVCDLCPDTLADVADSLAVLSEAGVSLGWYDHHQWDVAIAEGVRDLGVDLVIGDSDEECTADVVLRALEFDFDPRFAELAVVTRDHDLWIKEDERSDDLADYAYWVEDHETYVETVREHGVALPADVESFLAEKRVRKQALIDRAVDRAEIRSVGPWTVGVTYGRCSQNEVAERLRVEAECDAAVIVKPSGAASIRGSEGFERCHEVAEQVQGGGHPRAAGCKPDVYNDILDYAHHWVTQGEVTKRTLLGAFETLLEDEENVDSTSVVES